MTTLQNVEDAYPLTATQEGMVFHTLSNPGSGVYVTQILTPISGSFDVSRFEHAWDAAVARHPSLRTAFVWDGLDDPLQVVRRDVTTDWQHLDLQAVPSDHQQARIDAVLAADRERGFDLAVAPLSRMTVIRTGTAEWLWVWSFHHVIADGWSANLVLDDVLAEYGGAETAPAASVPYRDFISAYLDRDESKEESFWRERHAGFSEPQTLTVPGLQPVNDAAGHETHSFALGADTSQGFADLARDMNVTLNTAFVGVWALIVASWTRSTDVMFGTTVAGRPAEIPGIDETVGLFINTLPQRIPVTPRDQLGPWLRDVQRAQIETREFEQSSLASVQRWSELDNGQPLFDNILVFENYPRAETRTRLGEMEIGNRTYLEQSNYPLAVLVIPGDAVRISLVFDTAVFPPEAMASLERQVRTLVSGMIANPDARLGSLNLTAEEDMRWLKTVGIGPSLREDVSRIDDAIRRTAAGSPHALAVVDSEEEVTYEDLVGRADVVARQLAALGVGRGELIGLHLPRSAQMITGMLGILTAGAAYVPLDPDYPPQHLTDLLASEGIRRVLTSAALAEALPDGISSVLIDGPPHVDVDNDLVAIPDVSPSDLAYVIHTSGSSGRAKGVAVTHANLVQSTRARSVHYHDPVGRFMLVSSFSFDSSVAGIFWTLTTGGTLVLPDTGLERDADAILDLIRDQRVTHTLCLPSLYEVLLEQAEVGQLSSLDVVIVAGEVCPPRVLDAHLEVLPETQFHNEYGPTEATVWCLVHRAVGSEDPVPIGRPIAGSRIYVIDAFGNAVPPGFAGEICIAGAGVVQGYLDRPDLTAEKFVATRVLGADERIYRTGDLGAWRPDGSLLYLGRTDAQLKIRGHRIEPSSVEAALRAHPSVAEAVAIGSSVSGGRAKQLVAYVATDRTDSVSEEIKRDLAATMPDFMVPDIVVQLEALPRLPNGKIALTSLPDPASLPASNGCHVAPRNDRERILATIWGDLLGIEEVGVHDDFFELGGDSIVSIRMISRARQQGIDLQPGLITSHPTIEQLAASSLTTSVAESDEEVSGNVPLGPIQRWFFEASHPEPNHWNMANLFAINSVLDAGHLQAALEACVAHHDMLRSRFVQQEGGWSQWVDATASISLETFPVDAEVDEVVRTLNRGLDLSEGPVIRVALIRREPNEPDLLLIAIHHLVMDAVSWAILIDDLESAYTQASSGGTVELPRRTTSYRDWITHLGTDTVRSDVGYWLTQTDRSIAKPQLWGTEADAETVSTRLDQLATTQLLTEANDAYRTTPEELMIAALGHVLDSQQSDQVRIALERHGRPADLPDVDLSRTIGWFTAQFPIKLDGASSLPDDAIKSAKERVRAIPGDGVGYGALRYLHRESGLVDDAEPMYVFNYLSRASGAEAGMFRHSDAADRDSRHPRSPRGHRLEIVAAIVDESLQVDWYFSSTHDDLDSMQRLADSYLDRLRLLVSHCVSDGTGSLTPADFPAAGLDQSELDSLLEEL